MGLFSLVSYETGRIFLEFLDLVKTGLTDWLLNLNIIISGRVSDSILAFTPICIYHVEWIISILLFLPSYFIMSSVHSSSSTKSRISRILTTVFSWDPMLDYFRLLSFAID